MRDSAFPLLKTDALVTGYGKKRVVNGVSLDISAGEIVTLIGHNGAGKSTLLRAIFGLLPIWQGELIIDGTAVRSVKPCNLLRAGIAYVMQGNRVFNDLTVRENLELCDITLGNKALLEDGIERALTLFSLLKSRLNQRAGTLSGGEKQMLALANAIVLAPRLLLLDEPSLGLAPPLVAEAFARIQQICHEFQTAALIVEQKVREVLKIAERVYVLRNGQVSFFGPSSLLSDDVKLRDVYF